MFADLPLLSLVIWAPIIGGVLVLFAHKEEQAKTAKMLALVVSVLTFLLSAPLYTSLAGSPYLTSIITLGLMVFPCR
jgi:NADH-quinone oxidoreductase subunit M